MSDRDSRQLATKVVGDMNQAEDGLRSAATSAARIINGIDNILADSGKKAILLAGLAKLGVDLQELKTDKTVIFNAASRIHAEIPEPTK